MLKIDLTLTLVVTIKQPTVEQTSKDLVSNTRIDFIETILSLAFFHLAIVMCLTGWYIASVCTRTITLHVCTSATGRLLSNKNDLTILKQKLTTVLTTLLDK